MDKSFDDWMKEMILILEHNKKCYGFDDGFVESYSDRSMWEDLYKHGYSPFEAITEEMSYWEE